LNISLLLGVVLFAVNFSNKVRNNFGALKFKRSNTCSRIIHEVVSAFLDFRSRLESKEISVFGLESAKIMGWFMVRNHRSESSSFSANWSVDKREFSDVVFVNHVQKRLLLVLMDHGVSQIVAVRG